MRARILALLCAAILGSTGSLPSELPHAFSKSTSCAFVPQKHASSAHAQPAHMRLRDGPYEYTPRRATADGTGREHSSRAGVLRLFAARQLAPAWAAAAGVVHMSFCAMFLLSLFACAEAPLAFVPRGLADPFFDGWFIRLTDVEKNLSCAVIVGSLRHAGARTFSQHYIALSYSASTMARSSASSPDQLQSVHVFTEPEDVQITLDGAEMNGFLHETDWRAPAAGRSRSFKWQSAKHGAIHITGKNVSVNFTLPGIHGESLSLCADLRDAVSWGACTKSEHGPEGWLGKVGILLPCRYFVQSLASRTTYSLQRKRCTGAISPAAPATPATAAHRKTKTLTRPAIGGGGGGGAGEGDLVSNARSAENAASGGWSQMEAGVAGQAMSHVETNYGAAFPSGWIYAQVVGGNGVTVLVTGGEFGIGPISPLTYIVAVRGPGGFRLDFRTTDLAIVKVSFSCQQRRVRLLARGALGYGRVDVVIRDSVKKHDDQAIWVPTRQGFSREPGCSESFGASARIMAWGTNVKWHSNGLPPTEPPAIDCELPNSALEFGGNFQSDRPDLQADLPSSLLW